ncbi:DUF6544 family protein [Enterococcus sp. LJL51]|uniref:DUF6544 family protein n=1 Tax=Enterococcus sp. LJL51 TaxID=3416656 RepID=UPI003CE80BCF
MIKIVGGLGLVIVLLYIYLLIPGGKLWQKYLADTEQSFAEISGSREPSGKFSKDTVAQLPPLLQRHITNGGYLEKPLMSNMFIQFINTKFRLSPDKKTMPIQFQQLNFAGRPDRHAFLTAKMAGVLPLQAKDSVIAGIGSMTGVLAKHFQLFRSTGAEMDQGQLITALADAVYLPSLFVQDFVTWRTIDEQTVEGCITWENISAAGRFSFDEQGNIIRFDTDDRYMDDNGKGSKLVPWYVLYANYQNQNGFWQPGKVQVNWQLPEGAYTYFESNQIKIEYSVEKFPES